jgi:hypothetical protein
VLKIQQNDFIAPMVNAIQKQQAIIEALQKQANELKALINKLVQGSSFK